MRQDYDQHDIHGSFQGTSNAQGLACGLAKAALAVSVALCSGNIAFAEDSHHGAASFGHGDSHSGFSYNYAEGRLIDITIDDHGADLDGTGFEFEGSVGLGDKFQAYALYKDLGFDQDIDVSEWAVGFGTHLSIVPGADFVAEIGYISEEKKEAGHSPHSDEGLIMGLGVRKKVGEKGEVQFGVNYIDFSEAGSVTSYELVGEMHVLPSLALGVGVTASSEATAYFAEARFYFGH